MHFDTLQKALDSILFIDNITYIGKPEILY